VSNTMCKICGSSDGQYCSTKLQVLCKHCSRETPRKVGRDSFDARYWVGCKDVPESTKREFYIDYLRSGETLTSYIRSTQQEVEQ